MEKQVTDATLGLLSFEQKKELTNFFFNMQSAAFRQRKRDAPIEGKFIAEWLLSMIQSGLLLSDLKRSEKKILDVHYPNWRKEYFSKGSL